jgi:cilia- and flagella-associated protein 44
MLSDVTTGDTQWIFGRDGRGVGCVAVHPSRKYFAVGEKGDSPNVYIHEYPSLAVIRVLRKGTERAYSDLSFSSDGKLVATVGAAPDFLLTVWEWESERMALRTKAFAQEAREPLCPLVTGFVLW